MKIRGEIKTLGTEIYILKRIALKFWKKIRKIISIRQGNYIGEFNYGRNLDYFYNCIGFQYSLFYFLDFGIIKDKRV